MVTTVFDPNVGNVVIGGSRGVWAHAGAPTSGTSGTFANQAQSGDLLVDTTNKTLYQNTNTAASPTWTQLTSIGGAGAYSGTFDGIVGGVAPAAGAFTTVDGIIGSVTPAAATVTTLSATGEVSLSKHDTLTALAGGGRTGAAALDKQFDRLSVVATAADSAVLPAAAAGDWRLVINDGVAAAQVFANGTDTIDGTAGATGVVLPNGFRAMFFCLTAGAWQSIMGPISAASLKGPFDGVIGANTPAAGTFTNATATGFFDASAGDTISAAGTTRADATAMTKAVNHLTTVAASTGVILPASATVGIGGSVVVVNDGVAAAKVYAAGSDTIDGTAGATGVTLTNAKRALFVVVASGKFVSMSFPSASA
jgi:hypothetical protein